MPRASPTQSPSQRRATGRRAVAESRPPAGRPPRCDALRPRRRGRPTAASQRAQGPRRPRPPGSGLDAVAQVAPAVAAERSVLLRAGDGHHRGARSPGPVARLDARPTASSSGRARVAHRQRRVGPPPQPAVVRRGAAQHPVAERLGRPGRATARACAARRRAGRPRCRTEGRGGTGLPETMSATGSRPARRPSSAATTHAPSPHDRQIPSTSFIAGPPVGPVSPRQHAADHDPLADDVGAQAGACPRGGAPARRDTRLDIRVVTFAPPVASRRTW